MNAFECINLNRIYMYRNTRLSRAECSTEWGLVFMWESAAFLDGKREKGKRKPAPLHVQRQAWALRALTFNSRDRHLSTPLAISAVPGWRMQDGSLCWSGVLEEGKRGSRLVESSVGAVAAVVTIRRQLSGLCSWWRLHEDGITICVRRMRHGQYARLQWFIYFFTSLFFTFIIKRW